MSKYITRPRSLALTLVLAAAAAAVTLPAARAFAQDQAAIDKLVQMNKKALEDYDTLEWDAAKRTLLDALMTGKKAGLENHPVMARTYVHLGAVYITGFKNREKAIQSFVRAFEIDPNIQLSKGIATADVNEAFAEAARKVKGGGSAGGGETSAPPPARKRRGPVMEEDAEGGAAEAPPPRKKRRASEDEDESGEPDLPIRITALDCPEPDEAILEKAVILRCAVSPKLPVTSVVLHYRAPGKEEYADVEMKKTPKGWWQGKIPKKAVVGKSLQYFYEGQNDAGKPVVANGDRNAPNIMLIVEEEQKGKAGAGGPGDEEEENPLDEDGRPKKPKIYLGRRNTETEGLDTRFGKRQFWIGIGIGSGYGYAKGDGLEAVNMAPPGNFHNLQSVFLPGLAWAGIAQLAPEFGYQINPDLAIAIEGRFQYINQPADFSKYGARGAISALAKLMYYTKQSQLRFFGTLLVGGGEGVRFIVKPATDATMPSDPSNPNSQQVPAVYRNFTDTIHGGPALAGLGGGLYYEMTKGLSFVTEVHVLTALPLFAEFVDVNLALQINLY